MCFAALYGCLISQVFLLHSQIWSWTASRWHDDASMEGKMLASIRLSVEGFTIGSSL